MDLRKELIDFGNELQKIGFNSFDSVEMVVDIYLKSINLSDCERQTVTDNKQKIEDCAHKYDRAFWRGQGLWVCTKCGDKKF